MYNIEYLSNLGRCHVIICNQNFNKRRGEPKLKNLDID